MSKTPSYTDELIELSGFNPNQPRDPKGTETGGQFASNGAGDLAAALGVKREDLHQVAGEVRFSGQENWIIRPSGSGATVSMRHREFEIEGVGGVQTSLFSSYNPNGTSMAGTKGTWDGTGLPGHNPEQRSLFKSIVDRAINTGRSQVVSIGSPKPTPAPSPVDRAKAKQWDDVYNEGGEGYNPYR